MKSMQKPGLKPVLVIMAAGMGSRYGGLKQLDPVSTHGQLIVDYSIYDAHRVGFETVIFIIKPEDQALFHERIGSRIERHLDVRYVYQKLNDLPAGYSVPEGRVKPWGTAHAVLSARFILQELQAPFAVINADDYYGPEAFRLIFQQLLFDALCKCPNNDSIPELNQSSAFFEPSNYTMVGYLLKNTVTENGTVARGICGETPDHFLTEITERTCIEKGPPPRFTEDDGKNWTELSGDTIVSMNLWGFQQDFLQELLARFPEFLDRALVENPLKAEYFLPSVVNQMMENHQARVRVMHTNEQWYGVTYRADKPAVTAALAAKTAAGLYPEQLWI